MSFTVLWLGIQKVARQSKSLTYTITLLESVTGVSIVIQRQGKRWCQVTDLMLYNVYKGMVLYKASALLSTT